MNLEGCGLTVCGKTSSRNANRSHGRLETIVSRTSTKYNGEWTGLTIATVYTGHHASRITPGKVILRGEQKDVSTISVSDSITVALVDTIRETLDQVKLGLITWKPIQWSTGIDPRKSLWPVEGADLDAIVNQGPVIVLRPYLLFDEVAAEGGLDAGVDGEEDNDSNEGGYHLGELHDVGVEVLLKWSQCCYAAQECRLWC